MGYTTAEIIRSLAVALRSGATKQDLERAISIHPSIAEELFILLSIAHSKQIAMRLDADCLLLI